MSSISEILASKYAQYGTRISVLAETIPSKQAIERKWESAIDVIVKRNPVEWFEVVIDEWLGAGLSEIKTVTDLKHWGYFKDANGKMIVDRFHKVYGLFGLNVEIDNIQPNRSCVKLYSPQLNRVYRCPDWDSLVNLVNSEKKYNRKI